MPLRLPRETDRAMDVLAVGQNSMDLVAIVDPYPPPNAKQRLHGFAQLPGGEAATAAVALAQLGWRAEYIGRFGGDEIGRAGLDSLKCAGVRVDRVVQRGDATSRFALILVDRGTGERTVLWDRHPDMMMAPEDVPDEAIAGARVVLVDAHETEAATSTAARARRMRVPTVVDVEHAHPGVDVLLREIDVIIAAESFPRAFTGIDAPGAALARLQQETGAAIVCVTLGSEGSLARAHGVEIATPAPHVEVVDTTGAGDVFRAGFIAGWLARGEAVDIEWCLEYAAAVAALNCRAMGARTSTPTRKEVEELMRRSRR